MRKKQTRTWVGIFVFIPLIVLPGTGQGQNLADVLGMDVVVHFIDVGIGDAILIELLDRKHEIIIDGGDIRRGYDFTEYLEPYIDPPVELAVVTHPDYDHWSGIQRLCKLYPVSEIWDPGYDRDCKFTGAHTQDNRSRDSYLKFIKHITTSQSKVVRPVATNPDQPAFDMDDAKIFVLHASADPQGPDCAYMINNASIVIKLTYRQVSFLFTGDGNGLDRKESDTAEPKYVEAKLLGLANSMPGVLKAEVLKVSHHGSTTANCVKFIRAVAPRYAIFSSSSTSHYHLPPSRVVRRFQTIRFDGRRIEKVLRTNNGEKDFEHRKFGDDHIVCGTNGEPGDVVCDYLKNFE